MHPKYFWKDFFVVRHTESYHHTYKSIKKNILYIYIYLHGTFLFLLFFFFSPVILARMHNDLFERGATVSRIRPSFSTMPVLSPLFEKSHWNTFLLRFCELYYEFFVVMQGRVNHHSWPPEKKVLSPP